MSEQDMDDFYADWREHVAECGGEENAYTWPTWVRQQRRLRVELAAESQS